MAAVRAVGLVVASVAALVVGGCSSARPGLAGSGPGEPAGVAGWAGPTAGEHLLLADGRLYSEDLDGGAGACFWFVSSTGTVVSLVWPGGWRARTGPLAVEDASGRVVARTFEEGLAFTGHFEAGRTGCAPGGLSRSFVVSRVERLGAGGGGG